MLDYKLIEAMAAVILEGGFERGAKRLHLTQSAISQRIKLLEEQSGKILVTRSNPPVPTEDGQEILKHYQQVMILEESLEGAVNKSSAIEYSSLSIGVNEDSLATWFLQAVLPLMQTERLTLDLKVDDQEQTLKYLKSGEVMGCISSHNKPVQGCNMVFLGTMGYRVLVSPEFYKTWFAKGIRKEIFSHAPAVVFNRKDNLHRTLLTQALDTAVALHYPIHYVPSTEQFAQFIIQGLAYGVVPDIQSQKYLESGELMELFPGMVHAVSLYWHVWNLRTPLLEKFTRVLTGFGDQGCLL